MSKGNIQIPKQFSVSKPHRRTKSGMATQLNSESILLHYKKPKTYDHIQHFRIKTYIYTYIYDHIQHFRISPKIYDHIQHFRIKTYILYIHIYDHIQHFRISLRIQHFIRISEEQHLPDKILPSPPESSRVDYWQDTPESSRVFSMIFLPACRQEEYLLW